MKRRIEPGQKGKNIKGAGRQMAAESGHESELEGRGKRRKEGGKAPTLSPTMNIGSASSSYLQEVKGKECEDKKEASKEGRKEGKGNIKEGGKEVRPLRKAIKEGTKEGRKKEHQGRNKRVRNKG
jgi:hypothetical protein